MGFYFGTNSIMPSTGGVEINNQDITVKKDGVYTYADLSGEYLAYPVPVNLFPMVTGGYLWLKGSVPEVGQDVYNSVLDDDNNPHPNLSDVLGKVSVVRWFGEPNNLWAFMVDWNENRWIYRPNDSYPKEDVVVPSFTGLGTVTVNTFDGYLSGSSIPTDVVSNISSVRNYALYGDETVETLSLPNCTELGVEACSISAIQSVSIPKYYGDMLDTDTGDYYQEGSWNIFANCYSISEISAERMQIIPNGFLQGVRNIVTIDAPNLIGFNGSSFGISWYDGDFPYSRYDLMTGAGIDLTQMKYLGGNGIGDYLEGFIADPDNSVTNTLSLPELLSIGGQFTSCEMTTRTYLDNITTLNIPNVKQIASWAAIELPITTVDLPSVISIGNNAFVCPNATTINIGSDVVDINSGAFGNCPSVTTININKAQDSIAGAPWGAGGGAATVNWTGA